MPDHPVPTLGPLRQQQVQLVIMQGDNAAVVSAVSPWGVFATGDSKREPGDKKNYGRGYRVAVARALMRLSWEILRQEKELMKVEARERTEAQAKERAVAAERAAQKAVRPPLGDEERRRLATTPEAVLRRRERARRREQEAGK